MDIILNDLNKYSKALRQKTNCNRRGVRMRLLYALLQTYRGKKIYREWIKTGKPVPSPHIVKQHTVKEFAKRFGLTIFIETGTYQGDMVYAVKNKFEEICSIELGMELYKSAKIRFAEGKHITILQGNSGEILEQVLSKVNKPCLFWLDGHYSAGITVKGDLETPIEKELFHISRHKFKRNHVILIDDARCFTGQGDYPSIQSLKEWAILEGFHNFEIKDDIIRIFNI